MRRTLFVTVLGVSVAACAGETALDAGADAGLVADAGPEADAGPVDVPFLTVLSSSVALEGLRGPAGDVKYLAPIVGVPPRAPLFAACYFQNMLRYDYHLLFLRSFPELAALSTDDYADLVLRRPTRIWWGGAVKLYPNTPHPLSGQNGTLAFAIYHENAGTDRLTADDVAAVDAILKGCVAFAPDALAFLPSDPFQVSFAHTARAALAQRGVAVIFAEELR